MSPEKHAENHIKEIRKYTEKISKIETFSDNLDSDEAMVINACVDTITHMTAIMSHIFSKHS